MIFGAHIIVHSKDPDPEADRVFFRRPRSTRPMTKMLSGAGRRMGFHYEDEASGWRRNRPLSTEASGRLRSRVAMKRPPLWH